jgi:hypothetical protein
MRIPAGKIQELPVFDENNSCYLLGTEAYTISLPKRDVKAPLQPGDMVKVFTFYNEEKELEATTKMPDIQVGEVGSFRVVTVNQLGAFIHIGTKRDMLIPMREMRTALEAGKLALVTLQVDHKNERLFASTRLSMYFKNDFIDLERGQEVDMIVADKIDIGRRVIINGKFLGVIFTQEMLRTLREGDKVKGYVRKIEGRDIQVSMSKEGEELIIDAKNRLMEFLENNNGYIRLNDDSDPEEIKLRLRMSKKTFKKAVGVLYKEQKVIITKFGVKLNKGDK